MQSVIKYSEVINSVAVIGNYLPRQCGIATFTTDLVEALSAEAPDILYAMPDINSGIATVEVNELFNCMGSSSMILILVLATLRMMVTAIMR